MPNKKRQDLIGPVMPRIPRFRSRQSSCSNGGSFKLNAWNPVTGAGPLLGGFNWSLGTPTLSNQEIVKAPARFRKERIWDTIPNPDFKKRHPVIDNGGKMLLQRSWWEYRNAFFASQRVSPVHLWSNFIGSVWCQPSNNYIHSGFFPVSADWPPAADWNTIESYGPTGFARAKPGKPDVSLGVALVELREIPRSLLLKMEGIKGVADFYLAVQMGWVPLWDDIRKSIKLLMDLDARLRFFKRNNGLPVRRRVPILQEKNSSILTDDTNLMLCYNTRPRAPSLSPSSSGFSRRVQYVYERNIWFSGCFRFYIDYELLPFPDLSLTLRLSGLEITPKAFWDLMPWSWLIDYVSNVGDIIDNLYDAVVDSQYAEWAYVMGHTKRTYHFSSSDGRVSASCSKYFETKARFPADRYGLQANVDLSPRQLSILIALGLQRLGS